MPALLRRLSSSASVALLAATAAGAPLGDLDSGQGWSLVRMDLDLLVEPASGHLEVAGVLRLRLDAEESLGPTIGVNTRKATMRFLEAESRGAKVELNAKIPIADAVRLARVRFATPKKRGDEIEVTYRCENDGNSYQLVVRENYALASWVETWYAVPLPRSLTGLSAADVSAPGRTRIAVPEGWTAVANGRRTSHRPGEATWESDVPVARSFAAAPFEESTSTNDGRETHVFLVRKKPDAAAAQARVLGAGIAAMEKRFGPYPYASYSIVEVPSGLVEWYAASEQGFIMAASTAFDVEGGNVPLFAHEAAHGWWGNKITTRGPGSLLCGESLAQYGAVVAIESLEGADAATEFLRFSRTGYNPLQCARGYFEIARQGNDKELAKLDGSGADHNLSDAKGHWMFHMLRERVGDATFFGVLRGVIDDRALGSLALQDLRARFVAAAPEARLERFFADWLDRKGAPILHDRWTDASDASGPRVRVAIEQKGAPYDLDLEVEVEGSQGILAHRVTIAQSTAEWTLPSPGAPRRVTVDPHHRVLMWKPEYGAEPESN